MTIEDRQYLIEAYEQRAQILIRLPQDAFDSYIERMSYKDRLNYTMFCLASKAEKARQAEEANNCQEGSGLGQRARGGGQRVRDDGGHLRDGGEHLRDGGEKGGPPHLYPGVRRG